MNDLLDTYRYLNQAMQSDPLLCLAHAVCWLDPLWRGYDDEDIYHDPDGILSAALVVTRQSFPDLYVDAIDQLRQGATYAVAERLICEGISATGIPLNDLDHLPYGIPLPVYGVDLEDPDFYDNQTDAMPALALFGIEPLPNRYHIDIPSCAYTAAEILAINLEVRPEDEYQQVAWLLRWLFSVTGNSICDWDYETMCEVEPLAWEPDDIDFARIMIDEANEIMSEALAGLSWLTSQPAVMHALQDNIHRIYKAFETKGHTDEPLDVRLEWLDLTICTG